jgi:hypothetical protein
VVNGSSAHAESSGPENIAAAGAEALRKKFRCISV